MKSFTSQFKRVGLACVALGSIVVAPSALAAPGTAAATQINNRATVNYQVGGVAQTPIESSPTGNSTPGVNNGANTSFVVDRKIDLLVQEVGNSPTNNVSPGQTNQVTTFFVSNEGNDTQGMTLSAANLPNGTTIPVWGPTPDAFDMTNIRVFVESTACTGVAQAVSYSAASDTATSIPTIVAGGCAFVYVVADAPVSATNGQASDVRLTVTVRAPTTLAALTETSGADTAGTVDVVFADSGRDALATADDQYLISAAALSVQKTSAVVYDPINGALAPGVFPKAIPQAIVEYGIKLTNTGGQSASVVTITDSIPANTTFTNNVYSSGTRNVSIAVGATTTFCQAEAGGTDSNSDGCFLTAGGVLTVGSPALSAVATGAANAVTVSFRVTIN